jgi:hypothetical protein
MAGKDQNGWYLITPQDESRVDCFKFIAEAATEDLYRISATDKAAAIPVIKLWRLQGGRYSRTNKKVEPALTNTFFAAPKFGQSVASFGERPAASITSLTVKKTNPGGWILFREVDLELTVHRPDVLDSAQMSDSPIGALLTPGSNFYLEYGWEGGENPILNKGRDRVELNPSDVTDSSRSELTEAEIKVYNAYIEKLKKFRCGLEKEDPGLEPRFYGVVYEAQAAMRFIVTTYNFSIQPDGQFKFNIHGVEDGELQVREAGTFDQFLSKINKSLSGKEKMQELAATMSNALFGPAVEENGNKPEDERKGLGDIEVETTPATADKPAVTAKTPMITLERVLDVLFAGPVRDTIQNLGYDHVHLYTGVFNRYSPDTNGSLGNQVTSNQSIGLFLLKVSDVQEFINKIASTEQQMTVANMLKQLLQMVQDPGNWSMKLAGSDKITPMVPELQIFTIFAPNRGYARFQIVDRKRYLTILKGVSKTKSPEQATVEMNAEIKKDIDKFLKLNHMPRWYMYHANSFFKDAKFEVVTDEQMKSIFIGRALKQNRTGITSATEPDPPLPIGLLIYRSAIKGTVTTIGNFGYDLMGQVWVDFGIDALNGIFYVLGKVDKITSAGFYSEITLQSEGSNPLGAPDTATDKGSILALQQYMERSSTAVSTEPWNLNDALFRKPFKMGPTMEENMSRQQSFTERVTGLPARQEFVTMDGGTQLKTVEDTGGAMSSQSPGLTESVTPIAPLKKLEGPG